METPEFNALLAAVATWLRRLDWRAIWATVVGGLILKLLGVV